jgi:hypothetical protein
MQFKPFEIFVGYNNGVTEYLSGRAGKIPTQKVIEWLDENIGRDKWQYDWEPPVNPVIKNSDSVGIIIEQTDRSYKNSGATFYFDSDEDRLLFCLKWFANGIEDSLFWHPV